MRTALDDPAIHEMLTARRGKWTVAVVLSLRGTTLRFTELRRGIGVSQKALTATLRALERDGLVSRTSYATIPPRVEYALTDLGREALRVFEALEDFALRHSTQVMASRRRFDGAAGTDPLAASDPALANGGPSLRPGPSGTRAHAARVTRESR